MYIVKILFYRTRGLQLVRISGHTTVSANDFPELQYYYTCEPSASNFIMKGINTLTSMLVSSPGEIKKETFFKKHEAIGARKLPQDIAVAQDRSKFTI